MERPVFEGEKNKQLKDVILHIWDRLTDLEGLVRRFIGAPEPKPVTNLPKPAEWSQSSSLDRPWRPIGDGKFWMPPVGNMVPRDEVPEEVLAQYENENLEAVQPSDSPEA